MAWLWIAVILVIALAEYRFGALYFAFWARGNHRTYYKVMIERHMNHKDWKHAQYFVNLGLKRFPNLHYFHDMKGLVYYRLGDFNRAIDAFLKSKSLAPAYSELDNIIGDTQMQLGHYDASKIALDHFLLSHPENTYARLNLAMCEFHTKNYQGALKVVDQVIGLEPHQKMAYKLKGSILMKLHDDLNALHAFLDFKGLGGQDPQVNGHILRLYRKLEDYESCKSYAESLLQQGEDEPSYYTHLGDALCHLGKVQTGIAMLHQAVQLDDHQFEAHYLLAKLMALMHRKSEALEHLRQAISDYPKYTKLASEDEDFNNLRFFRDFYRLIGNQSL